MHVTARPLALDGAIPRDLEVIRTEYVPDDLTVILHALGSAVELSLSFTSVIGFRVLDERDLLEYWPECSTLSGRVFEITSGGWLASESARPGSLVSVTFPAAREFLVAGCDSCVSVICTEDPVLQAHAL